MKISYFVSADIFNLETGALAGFHSAVYDFQIDIPNHSQAFDAIRKAIAQTNKVAENNVRINQFNNVGECDYESVTIADNRTQLEPKAKQDKPIESVKNNEPLPDHKPVSDKKAKGTPKSKQVN